jgi:transposase
VPRQNSTGGKARLGGISKRGDSYLRRLLVNSAHTVLLCAKAAKVDPWIQQDGTCSLGRHEQAGYLPTCRNASMI